jgi:molybdopterin molybdotransferase
MHLFEKAYQDVMAAAILLEPETAPLADCRGRILAEDIAADRDFPAFTKAAMDGYACRRQDLGGELVVVETIPAGTPPTKPIAAGQCAEIMTGAMVPAGADQVVRVEFTRKTERGTVAVLKTESAANICRQGEDARAGDILLRRGDRIRPQHVGVLAAVGCAHPRVARRPRVAIIGTGSELVEPGAPPGPTQIRNSNSYQLVAQVARAGGAPVYYGIATDTVESIEEFVQKSRSASDVIIVSGGVSAGRFDLVPGVLRKIGFNLLFEKIAVQPGMPTVFGQAGDIFCFGLPGNPVSSFVIFEVLVKPFLFKLMGHQYRPGIVPLPLAAPVRRKKADRTAWLPVAITDAGRVAPVEYHGSAHLNALCAADGLICVPAGTTEIEEGACVAVRPI